MTLIEQALIDCICREWKSHADRFDQYHLEGHQDMAFAVDRNFEGWLRGVRSTADLAGMKEAASLAAFAGDLWIHRTSVGFTHAMTVLYGEGS